MWGEVGRCSGPKVTLIHPKAAAHSSSECDSSPVRALSELGGSVVKGAPADVVAP